MLKPRQPRQRRNQPAQNPVSDMEQFYLNQYFQSRSPYPSAGPTVPSSAQQPSSHRFPPIEMAYLNQLEQRVKHIEQYLGLSTESSFNSLER